MTKGIFIFKFSLNLVLILLNTVLWCLPLYVLVIFKRLSPTTHLRQKTSRGLLFLSGSWVACNNLLLSHIARIPINENFPSNLNPNSSYLIISNHQSWVDIIILQKIFHNKIPFLRFFLKKQLFWLPLLGFAFWALDFPFMNRHSKAYLKKHPEEKGKDLEATIRTCRKIKNIDFSLINFPEGTRRSPQKILEQNSKYENLLKPKAGGLAFVLEAFEGNIKHLLDVSIIYPNKSVSMFQLLSGDISKIDISVREIPIPPGFGTKSYAMDEVYRRDFQNWVNDFWAEKDKILNQMHHLKPKV